MVELSIGEMYGSDWSRPLGYTRALVVDEQVNRTRTLKHSFGVKELVCSKNAWQSRHC